MGLLRHSPVIFLRRYEKRIVRIFYGTCNQWYLQGLGYMTDSLSQDVALHYELQDFQPFGHIYGMHIILYFQP